MKIINKLFLGLGFILFLSACETDLDQKPPIYPESSSLTDYGAVLNAAYFYHLGTATNMAIMGDFRADNAHMSETPNTEWDNYGPDLVLMNSDFISHFYTAAYRAILSSNIVIENSTDATEIAEAKFLRALAYFKLVRYFGDATINLSDAPQIDDLTIFERQPESAVYGVITTDLLDAIAALDNSNIASGRASRLAAQSLLGKVYMQMGDTNSAETYLQDAVNTATAAGVELVMNDYASIFTTDLNSEIIFATQSTASVVDEYPGTEFWGWFNGQDTKAFNPVDDDLINAFEAGDVRKAVTVDDVNNDSPKYDATRESDNDWIELRLADVILLYAEALNENNASNTMLAANELNKIRTRATLPATTATTQAQLRDAIQKERRVELAFEGQRWFDLVRTGTVDTEMGQTINPNYYVCPIPDSEIQATFGAIVQNPGY